MRLLIFITLPLLELIELLLILRIKLEVVVFVHVKLRLGWLMQLGLSEELLIVLLLARTTVFVVRVVHL